METQDTIITGIFEYDRATQRLYLHPDENSDGQFIHLTVCTDDNATHEWIGYDNKPMPTLNAVKLTFDQNRQGEVVIINPMADTMTPDEAVAHARANGRRIASQVLVNKQSKDIETFDGVLAV